MKWHDVCVLHAGASAIVKKSEKVQKVLEVNIFAPGAREKKTANVLLDDGHWYCYRELTRR